MKLISVVYL